MKLGEVLMKERERKKLSSEDVAGKLGIPAEKYQEIEAGNSPAETWGPLLANIAIKLETPTSRLLAESGKSADTRAGQAGELIRKHREGRGKTPEQMAEALGISQEEYAADRVRAVGGRGVRAALPPLRRGHRAAGVQSLLPVRPAARQAERRRLPLGPVQAPPPPDRPAVLAGR